MENLIYLFGTTAGVGIFLHLLFSKMHLRKRLAPKMQWWTPGALVILFACISLLLVRLFGAIDPAAHAEPVERAVEGAFLGLWLACVPVFSPNKRWDKP